MATIVGSIVFSVLTTLVIALADGKLNLIAIALPMAGIGFLVYGVLGSLVWFISYSVLASRFGNSFPTCLSTAVISSLICSVPLPLLANIDHSNIFSQVVRGVGISATFCIPTAIICAVFLWKFFLRANRHLTRR